MKRIANEPAGRARHSVRAGAGFLESGAQRTDAPYQIVAGAIERGGQRSGVAAGVSPAVEPGVPPGGKHIAITERVKSSGILPLATPIRAARCRPLRQARRLTLLSDRHFQSHPIVAQMLCLIAILVLVGCSKHDAPPPADEAKAENPWKISRNTDGESVVTLDAKTQTHIGLKLAPTDARRLEPERKAYGRVVDPATLSAALADFVAARATADASQKDLERIKTLAGQDNASARTLEAAQATAARDSIQADAARTRLVGAWGKAIADRENLRAFVESLASGESALVRLDLPAGEVLKTEPTGARVIALGDDTNSIDAAYLSGVPSVDPQTQSRSFLFLIAPNVAKLLPGAAVTGWMTISGEPMNGVVIPSSAVLRHEGKGWVYVQTGDNEFTRREIALDHLTGNGWFVSSTAAVTNRVVVVGAQQLLSEELKGQGGEE